MSYTPSLQTHKRHPFLPISTHGPLGTILNVINVNLKGDSWTAPRREITMCSFRGIPVLLLLAAFLITEAVDNSTTTGNLAVFVVHRPPKPSSVKSSSDKFGAGEEEQGGQGLVRLSPQGRKSTSGIIGNKKEKSASLVLRDGISSENKSARFFGTRAVQSEWFEFSFPEGMFSFLFSRFC